MGQIITLTRVSHQGKRLAKAEPVNLEAELEAEMLAYDHVAERTAKTLEAIERSIGIADICIALQYTLAGLAFAWLLGRIVTGI